MADQAVQIADLQAFDASLHAELDTLWVLIGALLVFLMQTGFAMLEVGSVNVKNTQNILLKNVLDASIGGIIWWLLGYGLAMGDSPSRFAGKTNFALENGDFSDGSGYSYAFWLFQWAFAATTATIVSGAVAERCTLTAYLTYSTLLIGIVYPIVVSVAWGGNGAFSPWLGSDDPNDYFLKCGVVDFAGSGVVHMTGGVAAFWGAYFLGPRLAFVNGTIQIPEYGPIFQTLGTLILWFGWYGFNGGSTLYIVGYGELAAKVMVTTTISAASGALSTLALGTLLEYHDTGMVSVKLRYVNNGVLAGLVGVTAGCAVVEPYGAWLIGSGASVVYLLASRLLKKHGIDDVVDAVPVHGFCGCYGVIMASLFGTKSNYMNAYGIYDGAEDKCAGLFYGGKGNALGAAIVFVLFVFAWTSAWSVLIFYGLQSQGLLRVDTVVEEDGMDVSEHGMPQASKAPLMTSGSSSMRAPPKKEATTELVGEMNPGTVGVTKLAPRELIKLESSHAQDSNSHFESVVPLSVSEQKCKSLSGHLFSQAAFDAIKDSDTGCITRAQFLAKAHETSA